MEQTTRHALLLFLERVCEHVRSTNDLFSVIRDGKVSDSEKPIPFFGRIDTAKVITVGVNPSSGEFKGSRKSSWVEIDTTQKLLDRLLNYFESAPHPWFQGWKDALVSLCLTHVVSYEDGTAAHVDLSPRATVAMRKARDKELFRRMIEADLPLFFECLKFCKSAKVLLMAGSVTGKFYINEFTQRFAPATGMRVSGRFVRTDQPGRGKTCWHRLEGNGINLPVFFCGCGPSDRRRPNLLCKRITENKAMLCKALVCDEGA